MNKTERIFKIEQLIAARKLVSFQALLEELEVSRATLKRDLEYLRSRMKTPIVYDRADNGYVLPCAPDNKLSPLPGPLPARGAREKG